MTSAKYYIEERKGLTKDKKGQPKVSYRVKIRIRTKGRKPQNITRTFAKRAAAEQWGKNRTKEIEQCEGIPETWGLRELTIGELIYEYMDHPTMGPKIGRNKFYVLRRLAASKIGEIVASQLTGSDVHDHCLQRLNADTQPSPTTIYHDVSVLKTVMASAKTCFRVNASLGYHHEALPELQSAGLVERSHRRERLPTEAEISRIFAALKKRRKHRNSSIPADEIAKFAIYSCMRLSEITRAKWQDFDSKAGTLVIRDRKDPRKKTGNHQVIPLCDGAIALIESQPTKGNHELIFPFNPKSVGAAWTRVVKSIDIKDLRFHDLRALGITLLLQSGLTTAEVMKVSGHRNESVLSNHYNRISPEYVRSKLKGLC
ncbi:site-specific integrase [Ferrimonas balearica]|uniref:tyrosine-type recombinase/integrase n=1 Tax=Ferrimonas balearica TaxID=44012 RepID=UPI001C55BEE2|nr:site-specific integrase [Ferrimonas balearica]MBW3139514.1 site-specific integrase [Ferrimonas balearica]